MYSDRIYASKSFVISLARIGVSGLEIQSLQNRSGLIANLGYPKDKVDAMMSILNKLFQAVYDTPVDKNLDSVILRVQADWVKKMIKK